MTALLLSFAANTHADLARVGPTNLPSPPGNGFPAWYQDLNGVVLDMCLPDANDPGGLQQGACLLTGIGINPPYSFPTNYPDELFYFRAVGNPLVMPNGKRATMVLALEGAFGTGAVQPGQQMVFTRIRLFAGVGEPGTYTVTHPYGVEVFPVDSVGAGNRDIVFSEDVGLAPGIFTDALHSRLGPFLQRADAAGNPLGPVTLNGAQFLSDGVATEFVTGSPFGTNYVMICGKRPDGSDIVLGDFGPGGPGTGICVGDQTFSLTGRLHSAASPIGSPLAISGATYSRDAAGTHVDVHANVKKVLATQPDPILSAAGFNQAPVLMAGPNVIGDYYAQGITNPNGELPGNITVINSADTPPTAATANVVDDVTVASATYTVDALGTSTLQVVATSSDKGFAATGSLPPTLRLASFPAATVATGGIAGDPASLTLTVTGLATPPETVSVVSSAGGRTSASVLNGFTPDFPAGAVFAIDDSVALTAGDPPITLPVLANDKSHPAAPPIPGSVTVLAPGLTPNLGSLAVDPATGAITFTSNGLAGTSTFAYTVNTTITDPATGAARTVASNPATVTIDVAAPAGGPLPVAAADGPFNVSVNTTLNIPIATLLANDNGNGGTLDPASLVLSNITGGTAVVNNATGNVDYTAGTVAGTFGFDYTVADTAATGGNRSAAAHVTIAVTPSETIGLNRQQCAVSQGRWDVRGTSTVSTNNTITLYRTATVPANPTAADIIGTAPVVNGAWQFGGTAGPCATPISLKSSLGTQRSNITVTLK